MQSPMRLNLDSKIGVVAFFNIHFGYDAKGWTA